MIVRYSKPTKVFPFFHNVKVKTRNGWKTIVECPTDGRPNGPALFATKEEMAQRVTALVKAA